MLDALAQELREAEQQRLPVAPISDRHPELTVADAYEVQALNASCLAAGGARLVGHKIGLTSKPMQEMLGVDQPDYGRVFDSQVDQSPAVVKRAALIAPRVEPELAFVLRDGLRGPDVTADDVLAATAYVLPALEVIDSRIADWKINLIDTVADNASCGSIVLGSDRIDPGVTDLAAVEAELLIGGEAVQSGVGAAVLGHPAEAVAWLANAIGDFGVELEAGHVVMSGSMTAAAPIAAGSSVVGNFGSHGRVELTVT